MSVIHMKTEHVEEIAQQMDWVILQMSVKPGKFRSLASQISNAWKGGGASRYVTELGQLAAQMEKHNADFQTLAKQVRSEVNEWVQADGSHDFKVATPNYVVAAGVGPQKPKDSGVDYHPIAHIVNQGMDGIGLLKEGADIGLDLAKSPIAKNPLFMALGPVLDIIGGATLFWDHYTEDLIKYQNENEREAATIVDMLFALYITKLKLGVDIALIVASVMGVFTAGVSTLVGIGAWVVTEGLSWGAESFLYQDSIHDTIVKFVAKNLDNPTFMAGVAASVAAIP